MIEIKHFDSIGDVPEEWDGLIGDNIYMSRKFESFMESADDCKHEYYMLYDDGKLKNIFMSCDRPKYNIAMFTKHNLYGRVKLFYVPLSVTRMGIAGEDTAPVLDYIAGLKGRKMVLNLEVPDINDNYAVGLTCPKCVLNLRFDSFDGYLEAMRSSYRYRYKKAMKKSEPLTLEYLEDNSEFSEEMYACYLQVYNKSRIKVEKLSPDFFRGKFFRIFVMKDRSGKVVGFTQLLENQTELVFEFVGVDYAYNDRYDTYHRMLLEIVRYGIEHGFRTIDFGQTADESKLKLGCEYTYLYAYFHSSNKLENYVCKKTAKKLQYRPLAENFNVFR